MILQLTIMLILLARYKNKLNLFNVHIICIIISTLVTFKLHLLKNYIYIFSVKEKDYL